MKTERVAVSRELFRSPLVPAAAVLSALGALCGLGSVGLLLLPESISALVLDLYQGGITEPSAIQTWKFIHISITAVCFLWAAVMAVCLWMAVLKRPGQGMLVLSSAAEWTLHAVYASGLLTLVYFIYRVIRYVAYCLGIDEGVYLIYAMAVSEGVMALQAGVLFMLLRRFLNRLSDTAAALALAVTGGTVGRDTIPGFAPTGFLLLGLLELFISGDRIFTMTAVYTFNSGYYVFPMAEHPLLLLSGIMFALCAITNLLLSIYLFRRKRRCEQLLFLHGKRPGKA